VADPCAICDRLALSRAGTNPFLITEFAQSLFVVGDHQFYKGYALLLLKRHVRELHEMEPAARAELYTELDRATAAIVKAFTPWKMNHLSLGNTDQHVHWHLMPRYQNDPEHHRDPFRQSDRFKDARIGEDEAHRVAALIRAQLA